MDRDSNAERRSPPPTKHHDPVEVWARLENIERRPRSRAIPPGVDGRLRPAGVLIPVYQSGGHPHLLLTRRTMTLPTHKGEISFPGGGKEDGDADTLQTALRETEEELGISPSSVRVIAPFDVVVSIAGYEVSSYLGQIPKPPVPRVNSAEVDEVIEVDLVRLLDTPTMHRIESVERWGNPYDLHFYHYDDHVIWGMTGGLLHRLLLWLDGTETK